MIVILRNRRFGYYSCRGIAQNLEDCIVVRSDNIPHIKNDNLMLVRWGCTSPINFIPQIELNNANSIRSTSDKTNFRRILNEHDLCPETWFSPEEVPNEKLLDGVILRSKRHFKAQNFEFVHERNDLNRLFFRGGYASEYIEKESEFRVFIFNGKVIAVVRKIPHDPQSLTWNSSQGSTFINIRWSEWPLEVLRNAVDSFSLSGLNFGGVDVMCLNGIAYTLEINTACTISPYRQTKFTQAIQWTRENGNEYLFLESDTHWKHFIHPSIYNE